MIGYGSILTTVSKALQADVARHKFRKFLGA